MSWVWDGDTMVSSSPCKSSTELVIRWALCTGERAR